MGYDAAVRLLPFLLLAVATGCDDTGAGAGRSTLDAEVRLVTDGPPPDIAPDRPPLIEDCADGDSRPCGLDEGLCRPGIQRCAQGLWGRCTDAVEPTEERCNGLDEDCDGRVDEGFRIGGRCKYRDERGAQADGVYACDPATADAFCAPLEDCEEDADGDGVNVCQDCDDDDPNNYPAGPERCDGRDNDCDGLIDEPFQLDEICYAGLGVCRRGGTSVCDARGIDVDCDAEPMDPQGPELCGDDTDDDCDGATDEGFDLGQPCFAGVGACRRAGVSECTDDGTGVECSVEAGDPEEEVCGNGLDDDCDGNTDEGFDVGIPCRVGVGGCARPGVLVCAGDEVVCDAEAGAPGVEQCGNAVDDDCDGSVDESFDVGLPCSDGVGACRRDGVRVCNADRDGTLCSAAAADPGAELCGNGRDDDCDLQVDEGFAVGAPCESGQGECLRRGNLVCSADGREVECGARAGDPAQELCDERDNDCDGRVDEGYVVGVECEAGRGECRNVGRFECNAAGDGVACDVEPLPARPELCDERDNDCDEAVDEDFAELGQACDDDDPDLCARGFFACDLPTGRMVCTDDIPSPEDCNHLDDDCDERIDEGFDLLSDADHCGACNEPCGRPHGRCTEAVCYLDYWVWASEGSNADGEGTRARPWRTITHANGVARGPRAVIHVLPGTYSQSMHPEEVEEFPIQMQDTLTITGEGNPLEVVVDGDYGGSMITADDTVADTTRVERLTLLRGGSGADGFEPAVILRNANITFRDVVFEQPICDRNPAAIDSVGGEVLIDHCTVRDGRSATGRVIVVQQTSGTMTVQRSHFLRNDAGEAPGTGAQLAVSGLATLVAVNNSIVNGSANGIRVGSSSDAILVHNTVAGNADTGLYLRDRAGDVTAVNNVFAFQGRYAGRSLDVDPERFSNNLLWENPEGAWRLENGRGIDRAELDARVWAFDNFMGDPRFFSLPAGNTRPLPASAVIDRADPELAPPVDQDDRPRPLGEGFDVGAYEAPADL